MAITLEGVRQNDWVDRAGLSRAMSRTLARKQQVAYRAVAAPKLEARPASKSDMRAGERKRSRLQSAKLLNQHNQFICECLVHDRSSSGLRLKLARNVRLPDFFRVYLDETDELRPVTLVWRRDATLGVRFRATAAPASIRESTRNALRGRYYAIPN